MSGFKCLLLMSCHKRLLIQPHSFFRRRNWGQKRDVICPRLCGWLGEVTSRPFSLRYKLLQLFMSYASNFQFSVRLHSSLSHVQQMLSSWRSSVCHPLTGWWLDWSTAPRADAFTVGIGVPSPFLGGFCLAPQCHGKVSPCFVDEQCLGDFRMTLGKKMPQ